MSRSTIELAAEIVESLHEQLYRDYVRNGEFAKPFGQYVAEQYELIYDGINNTIAKRYE